MVIFLQSLAYRRLVYKLARHRLFFRMIQQHVHPLVQTTQTATSASSSNHHLLAIRILAQADRGTIPHFGLVFRSFRYFPIDPLHVVVNQVIGCQATGTAWRNLLLVSQHASADTAAPMRGLGRLRELNLSGEPLVGEFLFFLSEGG